MSREFSNHSVSCVWSLSVFLATFNSLLVVSSLFCSDALAEVAVASELLTSLSSLSLNTNEAYKSDTCFLSISFSLFIVVIEVWISIRCALISNRGGSHSSCSVTSCAISSLAAMAASSWGTIWIRLAAFRSFSVEPHTPCLRFLGGVD